MKTIIQDNLPGIILLLFSTLFVLFHISLLGENVYWWNHDSADYIEAARNYSTTGDLVVVSSIINLNDTVPIESWPVGYPVILSYVQDMFDLDSQWLTVYISILSWAIVPSIIFIFTRPLLGTRISIFLSILVLTSPAALDWGWIGMTDMPFLLVVLLGFLFSCNLKSGWKSTFSIFIGGVLLGASYSIRYAGAAALMAVFISYALLFFIRHDNRREVLHKMITWCFGAATILVPILIYNILISGMILPYGKRPGSTTNLLVSIQEYTRSTIHDIFGPGEAIFDLFIGVVLVFIGVKLYLHYRHSDTLKKRMRNLVCEFSRLPLGDFVLIVVAIYSMLGIAIVIYSRTTYHWGGGIGLRLVMQYDWAILTIFFFLLLRLAEESRAKMIIYTSCVLMILGHLYYFSTEYYFNEKNVSGGGGDVVLKYDVYHDDSIIEEVTRLSNKGGHIASNFHDTLRIRTGLPIRRLYLKKRNEQELMDHLQGALLEVRDLLLDTGKEGHIFVFLKVDMLDKIMEKKLSVPGVIRKRWNESLVVFSILPD